MLGDRFDDNTQAAWVELWSLLCLVMIPSCMERVQALAVAIGRLAAQSDTFDDLKDSSL